MLGLGPVSSAPISALSVGDILVLGTASFEVDYDYKLCLASSQFMTPATDTPARQMFDDRLGGDNSQILTFSRTILGGDLIQPFGSGAGELQIINLDGKYDFLLQQYAIDGRPVEIRIGRNADLYKNSVLISKGVASNWSIEEDMVRIAFEDFGYQLDTQLQASLYSGAGGPAGGADLEGKPLPLCYGEVFGISPPLVDPPLYIYQVHDGQIESISAVYDRGIPLTLASDFASSAALAAATTGASGSGADIEAGEYGTCLAEGYFRLGAIPDGQITANVEGDKTSGVYVATPGLISRRILSTRSALSSDDDLYLPAFIAFELLQAASVGWWWGPDERPTIRQALEAIMAPIGGVFWFRREGKLALGMFLAPDDLLPVARFTQNDIILGMRRERLPPAIDPPPWLWRVGWEHNYTVQPDLGSVVDPAHLAFAREESRFASASDELIILDHPRGGAAAPIDAHFVTEAAALAEATRLLALYRRTRGIYRFKIPAIPGRGYKLNLMDVIEVTYPRWDLSNGRNLRVVSLNDSATDNEIEIAAFG